MGRTEKLIERLKAIKVYAMLSASDVAIIDEAIEYINNNEERMRISRPNPLCPYDVLKSESD